MSIIDTLKAANQSNNSHLLMVDDNGELILSVPGVFDKIKMYFGYGNYSSNKIATYVVNHQDQIINESIDLFKAGQPVSVIQEIINDIFTSANMKSQTPDIVGHIFSDWMSCLPDAYKAKPITELVLPASHDSAAYKVDWSHQIEDSTNKQLTYISKILQYAVGINKLVDNWTITQNEGIDKQLEHGIRLFDLRVAYDENDSKFHLMHTFNLGELEPVLEQFKDFADKHPNEAVMIKIDDDYLHRFSMSEHKKEFCDLLYKYFGERLNDNLNSSLNDITNNHKNIFLFYDHGDNREILSTDNLRTISHWQNQVDVDSSLTELEHSLMDHSSNNDLLETIGFTVTPQIKTILFDLSLFNINKKMHNKFEYFIETHPDLGDDVSAIYFDFPTIDIVEKVIRINMDYHH